MKKVTFFALPILFVSLIIASSAHAGYPTRALPSNPSPVDGGSPCLASIEKEMSQGEIETRTIRLEAGQVYWFSASGCVRVDRIGIFVLNPSGMVLKEGHAVKPSFCFKARVTANYTFKLKVDSLEPGNHWGNVDSCVAKSNCD